MTGRRADGYHALESLVVFADVGDNLIAVPAPTDTLNVSGPFAKALTSGQTNLVAKAMAAFRAHWPDAVPHGICVDLVKNLPVSAGIGGGSADAAAAIRLMARFAQSDIPIAELSTLAQQLGADVPVCLISQPCLVRGIGEIVQPVADLPLCHVVLVNPLVPVATADIFRALKNHTNLGLPTLPQPFAHAAMLGLWMAESRNDLEPTATEILPVIGELITAIAATSGCVAARMSGSGATVFGLFGSSALAHQAAHDLRVKFPQYWVAAAPVASGSN